MASKFSVEAVFKAIDRVTAPVNRMQNAVGKFTRKMGRGLRSVNRQVDKLGKGLKKAAAIGTASLLLMGAAVTNVVATGAEFEQTLVAAAAKFPEGIRRGTEAFKVLEDVARKTGATTEFTAAQAASGLNFLAMAGFNAEQAVAALPGVVDLATAAAIDLGTASDIATDALGAFGLTTKDAVQQGKNLARVSDVLALTSIRTNTTIEALFEGIVKGAPAFTSAGQSMESFSALMGVMANSGIKGAEAGTILKNTVLRLGDPVSKAAKIMKGLGVRVADSEGNFRDILDIMGDFEKGLKGVGEVQRTAALNTVFGTRAVTGLSVQLKEGTSSIADYRKELEGAAGTSKTLAGVMRDTLQGRINSLTSATEGLKITLFKTKDSAIGGMVESLTSWVRTIDTTIGANRELTVQLIDGLGRAGKGILGIFGLLVAKFLILKSVIVTMAVVTKTWTAALIGFKVALAAIGLLMRIGPIGAILTLITLGGLLIANWDSIVSAISSAVSRIRPLLDALATPFKDLFGGFSSVLGAARGIFGGGEEGGTAAEAGAAGAQIVSPQDRVAKTIEERRETSTAELTIRDKTGRAELAQKGASPGIGIKLAESGAF